MLLALLLALAPIEPSAPIAPGPLRSSQEPGAPAPLAIQPLLLEGAEACALPALSRGVDGRVLLSTVRRAGAESVLELRELGPAGWSAAREVARGADWFVNWADFPSVTADARGNLLATWLQVSGAATYAYDVRVSVSSDSGATWSPSTILHTDRQPTEHGFVSIVPEPADGWRALWLDGRQLASGGAMALLTRRVAPDGALGPELVVDDRVCDCCGTALVALTAEDGQREAYAAAWRDRDADEVRDIAFARASVTTSAVAFAASTNLGRDGWTTRTCPVNGPRLAVDGEHLAALWYTEAGGLPRVQLAWSDADEGAPGLALRVDGDLAGAPLGRVDLAFAAPGELCAIWMQRGAGEDAGARLWVRPYRLALDRPSPGAVQELARVDAGRRSGFPRLVGDGAGALVAAWTEFAADPESGDEVSIVRTARLVAGDEDRAPSER